LACRDVAWSFGKANGDFARLRLSATSRHLEALRTLTRLELRAGRLGRGLELMKRIIAAKPRHPYGEWAHLGNIYLAAGQTKKALEGYRFLIQYYPAEDPNFYLKLSDLYLKVGNEGAA